MSAGEKICYVLGAGGSIGSAVVERAAREGFDVLACVRTRSAALEERLADLARETGRRVESTSFDMTDDENLARALEEAVVSFGGPYALVNCAGVFSSGLLLGVTMEELRDVLECNFLAPLNAIRLLAPEMLRKRSGSIVNIASIRGLDAQKGLVAYGSSKAALCMATSILAKELGPFGVRVNAIAPGIVCGGMEESLSEEERERVLASCPMKRAATPEEVAGLVAYLLADDSKYVNGEVIRMDGGMR